MTVLFFIVLIVVLLTVSGIMGLLATGAWWALVGLVIGFLARFLVRDSGRFGVLATMLAGIAGAVGGRLIAEAIDVQSRFITFLIALLVAAVVIAVTVASRRDRR